MHKQLEYVKYYGDESSQKATEKKPRSHRRAPVTKKIHSPESLMVRQADTDQYDDVINSIAGQSDFSEPFSNYEFRHEPVFQFEPPSEAPSEAPEPKGKTSFLERIALQEDCVDDREA